MATCVAAPQESTGPSVLRPPARHAEFVLYPDEAFVLDAVHVQGHVRGDRITFTHLTAVGETLAALVDTALPAPADVADERMRVRRPSPLAAVRRLADAARAHGLHFIGALNFEAAHIQEDLPPPDAPFLSFKIAACASASQESIVETARAAIKDRPVPSCALVENTSPRFKERFGKAVEHMMRGDIFEIVLTRRFVFRADASEMFPYLSHALAASAAPYRFGLRFDDFSIVGASPELLVRVEGRSVTNRPISGSLRRTAPGKGPLSEEERAQWDVLLASEKEKSELDMLIDLARHDLHRVCDDVRVSAYREPLQLETVVHTQATVTGTLKDGFDGLDALFSCLNAGTLVGAPKKMAMSLIARLEGAPRGTYGGNLVHVLPDGGVRATILIRTCHLEQDSVAVQAGATLLLGSDCNYEYWECGAKARGLLRLLGAENLCFTTETPPPIVHGRPVLDPRACSEAPFARDTAVGEGLSLLLVDNEDSFTFNLAALFESFGCVLRVVRNHVRPEDIAWNDYHGVVLSPGPASPSEAGQLLSYVKACAGKRPVFGVCLGFQAMVEGLGGRLGRMDVPLHGKSRPIVVSTARPTHLLAGLENGFHAARYHSLRADVLPAALVAVAHDDSGVVMALEGPEDWPAFHAVQFHPESFLTGAAGPKLCANWLAGVRLHARAQPPSPSPRS